MWKRTSRDRDWRAESWQGFGLTFGQYVINEWYITGEPVNVPYFVVQGPKEKFEVLIKKEDITVMCTWG